MAVKQTGSVDVKPRQVEQAIQLLRLTPKADLLGGGSLPWRSRHVKIAGYPVGSVHIFGGPLTSLSAKVLVSNEPIDGGGKVLATVTAEDVVPWGVAATHPAGQYLQIEVTALADGGILGITLHLAAQSGA